MNNYETRRLPSAFAENMQKEAFENMSELKPKPKVHFPIDFFPEQIQNIVNELNKKLNFPIDFAACSMLYAASVAIGNTCKLRYLWDEKPNLFMILVGKPGTNKSHPVEFAIKPILERDAILFKEYESLIEEFEKANAQTAKADSITILSKPVLKKHIVSDSSMEAIKVSMNNNKRGIGLWVDEIAGWLNGFKKYNSALEQWLSIWSGKEIIHERKNSKPFRIPDPFASVIGTIQSEIIDEIAKGNQLKNGFLDRMLFVKPQEIQRRGWNKFEGKIDASENWKTIIEKILQLDFRILDTNYFSNYLNLSPEAEQVILTWQNLSLESDKTEYGEVVEGVSAKIEIYVLRFALIIQILKWACGNGSLITIDKESAESAIALSAYFKSTAMEVFEHVTKKHPLDLLSDYKSLIYRALFDSFYTGQGVQLASFYGMPERTFKHWLATDDKLFKRIGHGHYKKMYNNR
jgi:hypothetical protein